MSGDERRSARDVETERLQSNLRSIRLSCATLLVVEGQAPGQQILLETGRIRLGSDVSAEFRLVDRGVSRRHAEIESTPAGFVLRDQGSTNGTFVNGRRVSEVLLEPGDLLTLGACQIRFQPQVTEINILPSPHDQFGSVYGKSIAMRQLFGVVERVSRTDSTILILGESGTGKDVLARSIHAASLRANKPFVVVDGSTTNPDLLASELFGHMAGSFTGASRRQQGAFEAAAGGTIFLDEVGELPLDLQPKFLRVLETREVQPLGSAARIPVDVRIIAATHRDLPSMVAAGEFREDLYYRLAVVHVAVPPLRDRLEDLEGLIQALLRGLRIPDRAIGFSDDAIATLATHGWKGNVRELRNVLERSIALAPGPLIEGQQLIFSPSSTVGETGVREKELPAQPVPRARDPLPDAPEEQAAGPVVTLAGRTFEEIQREVLRETLARAGGNQSMAARFLGIPRNSFRKKLIRYGLLEASKADAEPDDDPD